MHHPFFMVVDSSAELQPPRELDGRNLHSSVSSARGGFLLAGPCQPVLTQFAAAEAHQLNDAIITLVPLSDDPGFAEDWRELPAAIAARRSPPEASAITAIPIPLLKDSAPPPGLRTNVSFPIWDWLIRAADSSQPIRMAATSTIPGRMPSPRPRLVPAAVPPSEEWLEAHLNDGRLLESSRSAADLIALRAGLLQMNDFLDRSHQLSQSIEGQGRHAAGDYWHAIMHRREPDYGNSRYWFRRVGPHPLFPELAARAQHILNECPDPDARSWQARLVRSGAWDAFAFVELCEAAAADEDAPLAQAAREIQWQEMRLLLKSTYRDAAGLS